MQDLEEVEEWNEYGELKENIGTVPATGSSVPAPKMPVVPTATHGTTKVTAPNPMLDMPKRVALPGAAEIAARNKPPSKSSLEEPPHPETILSAPIEKEKSIEKAIKFKGEEKHLEHLSVPASAIPSTSNSPKPAEVEEDTKPGAELQTNEGKDVDKAGERDIEKAATTTVEGDPATSARPTVEEVSGSTAAADNIPVAKTSETSTGASTEPPAPTTSDKPSDVKSRDLDASPAKTSSEEAQGENATRLDIPSIAPVGTTTTAKTTSETNATMEPITVQAHQQSSSTVEPKDDAEALTKSPIPAESSPPESAGPLGSTIGADSAVEPEQTIPSVASAAASGVTGSDTKTLPLRSPMTTGNSTGSHVDTKSAQITAIQHTSDSNPLSTSPATESSQTQDQAAAEPDLATASVDD